MKHCPAQQLWMTYAQVGQDAGAGAGAEHDGGRQLEAREQRSRVIGLLVDGGGVPTRGPRTA